MNRRSPSLITSGTLPYMVSQPAPVGGGIQRWPMLFFLHGYDEGYPTPIEQALTRHGPFRPTSSSVATNEFIVVAPQMPISGDFWHRYADTVQELVQQIQESHHGDPERTFLTGFSFGGNGVFDLALTQPDLWRALWPVDPVRVPREDLKQPVWLSSGQISRRLEKRFFNRLHLERLEPDEVDNVEIKDRIYCDLAQDHVGTATLAYQDDRVYRWLLSR